MSKKNLISVILVSLIVVTAPFRAYCWYYDSIDKVKFNGFEGEGSFVENPAFVGDCFGYVLLGVLLAAIISEPQRIMNYNNPSDNTGVFVLECCTKPFGVLFGGFPWVIKKAFWDFPIWIGGGKVESSAYAYKPEVAPGVEVPLQLRDQPRTQLNEASADNGGFVLPPLVEPAALPESKINIPDIQAQLQADTSRVPQLMPINIQTEPLPPEKIIIPQIPSQIQTDTSVSAQIQSPSLPQKQGETQTLPSTAPQPSQQISIPGTTSDQPSQATPKTWEGNQVPAWLNKDLSE
ncbi:MAG TPA: hypothetical protein DD381_04375 [Lentisphaeria bacterium]|nr:MAG: hypothetical protein A2X47_07275 [Lentisphaerae bacterium GWF2_38_69]HBM15568.1 hypothetical protein [Lentisphaeria bacterium]